MKKRLSREDVEKLAKLAEAISRLSREEYIAFTYIWDNISVGEILFEKDMYAIHRINKPYLVARSLREKGLIERGEGCYNLARWLRGLRMKIGRAEELRRLLEAAVR